MSDIRPHYIKMKEGGSFITRNTKVNCRLPIVNKMLEECCQNAAEGKPAFSEINFICEFPDSIKSKVSDEFNIDFSDNDEGFVIDAAESIQIYASSDRGLFYGCISLIQMLKDNYLNKMLAYDYPVCPVRGLKVYLPSMKNIEYFKRFVDMICYFKYNTIMIEVGGAMEYKRHPEINSGWIEYCKEMTEYSGKAEQIQEYTFDWKKNSIHAENGGGEYLTQTVVKELVKYCKDRMLNVIPEVPSLSHCDYILLNNHEIAERENDPYPDTYCPSNPKSYEILFDILDEVVEVFEPSVVNIGHDEYYSIGICDKCKDRKPEEIFAEDINKIYKHLADKGVNTMLWGDKLLQGAYQKEIGYFGGSDNAIPSLKGDRIDYIPATYKAIDLIPKDIKILHWLWGFECKIGGRLEDQFLDRDMDVVFGNFEGFAFPDWNERIKNGVKGAIISNWSTLDQTILQRNGILFGVVYSYFMFWDKDYDDSKFQQIRDKALNILFNYRNRNILGVKKATENDRADYIEFLHTTDYKVKYKLFFDGIFPEDQIYNIGKYIIQYSDGTQAAVPIVYGENIGSRDVSWDRQKSEIELRYEIDMQLIEVSMTTLPVRIGTDTYYRFVCVNPCPEKQIAGIAIESNAIGSSNIILKSVQFI